MNEFKTKLEIETLKAMTYTQINELLNKLTLENKELKEQLRIGGVSQQRELLIALAEHIYRDMLRSDRISTPEQVVNDFEAINCG